MCREDILTDRWPEDLSDQAVFIRELTDFAVKLRRLRGDIALPEMQQILEDLFGEKPARSAVKDYVQRVGKDVGIDRQPLHARQGRDPCRGGRRRGGAEQRQVGAVAQVLRRSPR